MDTLCTFITGTKVFASQLSQWVANSTIMKPSQYYVVTFDKD